MCGIAGIIGNGEQSVAAERVRTMLGELEHRGPDDEGLMEWNGAVLGHRRLSVFDLTQAGHQPMISPDGETGIVFNGAIFNFLQLRKELERCGYIFRSRSDTEVLLHGFREWGIDNLAKRIEGMFAFAIWDNRDKRAFLVRDRLGVKPLVYCSKNHQLAFTSTIRALKRASFGGQLDPNGLIEYLEFGFLTDKSSIYQDQKKLSPATILEWENGVVTTRKYWDLPEGMNEEIDFDEAVEETERLFLEAVEKRLQADVPIGALLSGGIDSSLVCWAISKLGGDVTAFTIGVPGDDWDETQIAKATAQRLGIRHEILEMSGDFKLDVHDLVKAYAEPFACASALGLLDISEEVSKQATVLLTGDGGDDVFLGYPEHLNFWVAEKLAQKTPGSIAKLLQNTSHMFPNIGPAKRASSFLRYTFGGLGGVTRIRDGLPVYEKYGLLGERLKDARFGDREIPLSSGENLLSEFLKYDRRTRFVGEYLPKVDGGTMFHALEARSPFLDTRLWDFASSLPYSLRLKNRNLKSVLREIVRRRISPELADGRKQGFGVPVQRWLTGKWRKQFVDAMNDSVIEKTGLINAKNAIKLLERSEKGNWAPRQLWFILVLESWLRFEDNDAA